MPVASGSISFLGAANFRGHWNASANTATGSDSSNTTYDTLYAGGGSAAYHSSTNLTASNGDYWQITHAGTTNVSSMASWHNADWIIYSGSTWIRLPFSDTLSSIVFGNLDGSALHMGADNDKHVIFDKAAAHSGSSDFVYDYTNQRVGIGTDAPTCKLSVTGSMCVSGTINAQALVLPGTNGSGIGNQRSAAAGSTSTFKTRQLAMIYAPPEGFIIEEGAVVEVEEEAIVSVIDYERAVQNIL